MKAQRTLPAAFALAMVIFSGCDAVGTGGESAPAIDLGNGPLYEAASPGLVLPLPADSTTYFTTDADTTGRE